MSMVHLVEKYTFVIMYCSLALLALLELQGQVCKAAVTIYVTSYNITNTDSNTDLDIVVVVGFNPGEVDANILAWESTTRTPTFDFYYDTVTTDGGVVFSNVIKWNERRTIEERKQANGTVLITALLNNNPVGSDTFVISVHWHPEDSSVSLNYPGDNIVRGSQLTLTCKSSDKGNPTGHVVWLKDNTTMTGEIFKNGVISLDSVTEGYTGNWSCYHENAFGSGIVSSRERVKVMWVPTHSSLQSDPNGYQIIRGSTLTLRCSCPDKGNPPGQVVWVINGTLMAGDMYNSDVIVINSVTPAENGEWECYYENDIGKGTKSNSKTVVVKSRPSEPLLILDVHVDDIRLGDTLVLQCSSHDKGYPEGQPVWVQDDIIFKGTKYSSDVITIFHADASSNGVWRCYYTNEVGNSTMSNEIQISVKCLPIVHLDSINYKINSSFIYFHLQISQAYAAETLEIMVCAAKDEGNPCTVGNTTSIAQEHGIEEKIELPKVSAGTYYNVTFFFRDKYRIVTRHMISFEGALAQSNVPTILAAIFGSLLLTIVVIFAVFVYWRYRHKAVPTTKENTMHYVNVDPQSDENYQRNTDGVDNTGNTGAYEDVATQDVTTQNPKPGHASEHTNYMQLDHNDIRQTRNRTPELTVYQSLD